MALIGKLRMTESRCKKMEELTHRNGLCHTVRRLNGDLYTGEWKDHLRHGTGTQVWRRARLMYEGEWNQDARHGFGILYKLQPSTKQYVKVYSGFWVNGEKEGVGTYFYSSTARYEGDWLKNKRNGWGKMIYEDGGVYEGQWLRDKPHGQGALILKNGDRYEGSMKHGKKHGSGRVIYKDCSRVYEGVWDDDTPKYGTVCEHYSKNTHTSKLNPFPSLALQNVQAVLLEGFERFCSWKNRTNEP
ncbi:MORN repeat-containing protein 3 [Bagarius yarrelli]|uniref:MORN repeat-containing protein 3 n=1 Tax=Bagarius yarrelli TaxID=175774 RepID=A0A556U8M3_BAGYA|nr:MORN repeat-containing protein 3 [Bagarius yarrelli]